MIAALLYGALFGALIYGKKKRASRYANPCTVPRLCNADIVPLAKSGAVLNA